MESGDGDTLARWRGLGSFLVGLVEELDRASEDAFREGLSIALQAAAARDDHALASAARDLVVDVRASVFEILVTSGVLGELARDAALRAGAARSIQRCWEAVAAGPYEEVEIFEELWTMIAESLPPPPEEAFVALAGLAREVRAASASPLSLWPLEPTGQTEAQLIAEALDQLASRLASPRDTLPDVPELFQRPALLRSDACSGLEAVRQWRVEREAWSRVLARLGSWLPDRR